ncbi:hypothetical protein L0128_07170 [candidate division KSB1 bacterium]|nr:hypothetical protein [candidate division KSB1 bacterium]
MIQNDLPKINDCHTYMLLGNPYDDRYDLKTDGVILYGHSNFGVRAEKWQERDYVIHFMTSLISGSYDDYLAGKFDGEKHYHERQQQADGSRWEKGPALFCLSPTPGFIEYLKSLIKSAIDAGAGIIFLSEPEYAAETGYSAFFKEAWRASYGQPWQDPWTSVQSRYMSSRLKQQLLGDAIENLFKFAKEYAQSKGRTVDCYVALHSLINYTQWGIVSPQSQLMDIPYVDGILAQVSTTTARTPNVCGGIRKERTFETAVLEYGCFVNLVKGTNLRLIFMQDPVEEYPERTWEDYKQNYEATVVASLMYPRINRFLTVPWPKRIFSAQYSRQGQRADEKEPIPPEYSRQILTLNNTLRQLHQNYVKWDRIYSAIGIIISDSMMFQRGGPSSTDHDLSFFYGLAIPLLKHGLLIQPLPLEHITYPGFLDDIKILILSYAALKPSRPDMHAILAEWVKAGHVLIFIDDFKDPFNKVNAWWNSSVFRYNSPAQHLFELLGLGREPHQDDVYFVGRGRVILRNANPADFAESPEKMREILDLVRHAVHLITHGHSRFRTQNFIKLRRGPYKIVAVFSESTSLKSLRVHGRLINLFDPELTYHRTFDIAPGEQGLFFNLSWIDRFLPCVIASSSSIRNTRHRRGEFTFISFGPPDTAGLTKLFLPRKPRHVTVTCHGEPVPYKINYERFRKILTFQYKNHPDGIRFKVEFRELKYHYRLNFLKKWLIARRWWVWLTLRRIFHS